MTAVLTGGLAIPGVAAAATASAGGATATAAAGAGGASLAVAGTVATGTGAAASTSASAAVAVSVSAGPIGWLILGAEKGKEEEGGIMANITYDCWKRVLRDDESEGLSNGRLLKDVVSDPRIKRVEIDGHDQTLPKILLTNIWGDMFRIEYVKLPSGELLAAHAVAVDC